MKKNGMKVGGVSAQNKIAMSILQGRRKGSIKQEALAATIGCSRSYISKLEKGVILPSLLLATKIENALGLNSGILARHIRKIKSKEADLRQQMKRALHQLRTDGHSTVPLVSFVKKNGKPKKK